jgi:hypothetical protein
MIMSTKADTPILHMSPDICCEGDAKEEEPILCKRWLIVILLLSK